MTFTKNIKEDKDMFKLVNRDVSNEAVNCTLVDFDPCQFCDGERNDNDGCVYCDGQFYDLID